MEKDPVKRPPPHSHEPSPPSPQEPWLESSLPECDLGALGQPVPSTLEPGINLAHLNRTLDSYHFQPLVTHVWGEGRGAGLEAEKKQVLP